MKKNLGLLLFVLSASTSFAQSFTSQQAKGTVCEAVRPLSYTPTVQVTCNGVYGTEETTQMSQVLTRMTTEGFELVNCYVAQSEQVSAAQICVLVKK